MAFSAKNLLRLAIGLRKKAAKRKKAQGTPCRAYSAACPFVRGEEGISPVSLQYLQEPQGDSGGQTRGSGYAAPDPRVQRTPCTESGAPGDGMAKWVCRPCKRTARQRSR